MVDASTAIRAFAQVVERRPNARLVITAGKAPKAKFDLFDESEQARELSRSLGLLGRNVFFLDEWTPYDRRHAYLQDADIGLTLHANTAEAPFAARARYMDYIWAGLPCVLARGDEIAASFGAAGFATLVDPADTDATAQAILGLIDDPRSRAAAAERWPGARRELPLAQRRAAPCGGDRRGPSPAHGEVVIGTAEHRRALLRTTNGRPRLGLPVRRLRFAAWLLRAILG